MEWSALLAFHPHPLKVRKHPSAWYCDNCGKGGPSGDVVHSCTACDYDLCSACTMTAAGADKTRIQSCPELQHRHSAPRGLGTDLRRSLSTVGSSTDLRNSHSQTSLRSSGSGTSTASSPRISSFEHGLGQAEWTCDVCTVLNPTEAPSCTCCGNPGGAHITPSSPVCISVIDLMSSLDATVVHQPPAYT